MIVRQGFHHLLPVPPNGLLSHSIYDRCEPLHAPKLVPAIEKLHSKAIEHGQPIHDWP